MVRNLNIPINNKFFIAMIMFMQIIALYPVRRISDDQINACIRQIFPGTGDAVLGI
jgi:hypothetical protein